jgi:hypothetical protein
MAIAQSGDKSTAGLPHPLCYPTLTLFDEFNPENGWSLPPQLGSLPAAAHSASTEYQQLLTMNPQLVVLESFFHSRARAAAYSTQVGGVVPDGTNRGINGLASADRNNKATLPLTAPRCAIKSSAKDLSLRTVKLQYVDKD